VRAHFKARTEKRVTQVRSRSCEIFFSSVLHFFSQFLLFLGVVLGRELSVFFAFFSSFIIMSVGGALFCSVLQCISIFYCGVLLVAVVLCDATAMMTMMSFFVLFLLVVVYVVLLFLSFSSIIIIISRRRSGRSTSALFEFVQQRERGRVESVSDDWFVLVVDEETNHAT